MNLLLWHHSCLDRYITGVNISGESLHIQNGISSGPVAVFFKFPKAFQTSLSDSSGTSTPSAIRYVDRTRVVLIKTELPKIIVKAVQRLFIQSSVSRGTALRNEIYIFPPLTAPRMLEGSLLFWLITSKILLLITLKRSSLIGDGGILDFWW